MKFNLKEFFDQKKEAAIAGVIQNFMPALIQRFIDMNRPQSEGGLKSENEDAVIMAIAPFQGKIVLNIHPVKYSDEVNGMVLLDPIYSQPIQEMLASETPDQKAISSPTNEEE